VSYLLKPDETAELNRWFDEVKEALGLSWRADRGRVLASIKKQGEEAKKRKQTDKMVASYYNYKFYGDLVRAVEKAGEGNVIAVELPKEFLEVPTGWCYGAGKPDYNTASKHLPRTQKLVKKAWNFIESRREELGDDWVEQNRQLVIEAFEESEGWSKLEEELWKFYKEVEPEPEPSEVWLQATEESRATLESSTKLPPMAVAELLDYAELAGVEVTKQFVEWKAESNYADSQWFSYLLCAYLTKQQRPKLELYLEVAEDINQATKLGTLYDTEGKDPVTGLRTGAWDTTTTLTDLATAYNAYKFGLAEAGSWNELQDAILTALGKQSAKTN